MPATKSLQGETGMGWVWLKRSGSVRINDWMCCWKLWVALNDTQGCAQRYGDNKDSHVPMVGTMAATSIIEGFQPLWLSSSYHVYSESTIMNKLSLSEWTALVCLKWFFWKLWISLFLKAFLSLYCWLVEWRTSKVHYYTQTNRLFVEIYQQVMFFAKRDLPKKKSKEAKMLLEIKDSVGDSESHIATDVENEW